MFCEKAGALVRELKLSKWMPPFDNAKFTDCVREINELHGDVTQYLESRGGRPEPDHLPKLVVFHTAVMRNKRCLLAYIKYRMRQIEKLRWTSGGATLSPALQPNLHKQEIDFFTEYSALVNQYMTDVGLDLTADVNPPKDMLIQVRVLQPLGQVVLQSGTQINLEANTMHFMNRADAEPLILQGVLEHVG
ncbi:putative GINS complex subunit 1 [Paratrimastix pyriformis]|uniref:GINS complex subunit 1 n=1 Tax=Paratrimastix pyriformis TaxID=342808 RepID=A0ABQ8UMY9_9EUKA|nr:putative GINS complex subunit 1 [Paratrimastix pyriformis]